MILRGYPQFVIDSRKPFSRALAWCVTPISPVTGGGLISSASIGQVSNGTINPTWNPNPTKYAGVPLLGQKCASTSNVYAVGCFYFGTSPLVTSTGNGQGDYSFLFLADVQASGSFNRGIVLGNFGITTPSGQMIFNFSSNAFAATSGMMSALDFSGSSLTGWGDSISGAVDGNMHCWVTSRRAGLYTIYRDGVDVTGNRSAASTASIIPATTAGTGFAFGGPPNSTENSAPSGATMALSAAWNRSLSDAEMHFLGVNPFSMFLDFPNQYGARGFSSLIGSLVYVKAVNRATQW